MTTINHNYEKLKGSYLFSTIAKKVSKYQEDNPDADIIRLGIGDVTKPLAPAVIDALRSAVDDMSREETFKGYAPDLGYAFLRDKISECDYRSRGCDIASDEIFVSDGAKCDCANIQELFGLDNTLGICDPVYPVYIDSNVMAGRTGDYNEDKECYDNVVYMPTSADNGFVPELPGEAPDLIYLCNPNNPTGTVINKDELQRWVDYALDNKSVILYDAAYEAYISEDNVPHSIYECDGAKKCAIEFKSFSKTAGFTGLRLGYTVVPGDLIIDGASLHDMWARRHGTKYNGAPYIVQRAGEAIYSDAGRRQVRETIDYYMGNAKIILDGIKEAGFTAYGGVNAPYIWLKTPEGMDSWQFFDYLLSEANVVGTPGVGFGPEGEGYYRLTAFGNRERTIEAIKRIKALNK